MIVHFKVENGRNVTHCPNKVGWGESDTFYVDSPNCQKCQHYQGRCAGFNSKINCAYPEPKEKSICEKCEYKGKPKCKYEANGIVTKCSCYSEIPSPAVEKSDMENVSDKYIALSNDKGVTANILKIGNYYRFHFKKDVEFNGTHARSIDGRLIGCSAVSTHLKIDASTRWNSNIIHTAISNIIATEWIDEKNYA